MPAIQRFFIYARKSTDVEDKQVRSIEAQLAELRELAARCSLTIVEVFIEKESAKRPGRPIFNEMLTRIEAGEADGILAWHPDRLARNALDGGHIIDLLDTGKLRHIQFHGSSVENTPQGKMMLGVEFGFSKYYVDALSENVKRGHRSKVARGEFPCLAPLGYINDPRTKRIAVDRGRAPLVRSAFEMYAAGNATLDSIREYFSAHGVKTRSTKMRAGGNLVGRTFVSDLLSNPIYHGNFMWSGEIHEGVHKPIISKRLFDRVQSVLAQRWRYSPQLIQRTPKPYTGLLRCAECGGAISAEIQKGHTYYRCTKKNKCRPPCSQPYVREESLDAQITSLLSPFQLCRAHAQEMLNRLQTEREQIAQTNNVLIAEKQAELEKIAARLERLKYALIDGLIEGDEYRTEKTKLVGLKKTLGEEIAALMSGENAWLEPFKEWIDTAQTVGEIAQTGSLTEKKALAAKVFGSNLLLEGKKARGEAVKPWAILTENELCPNTAHLFHTARTYFQRHFS